MSCSQVQPVWAGDILIFRTRNCHLHHPLQPLTGETLQYATANNEDSACVDVSASGFCGGKHQKAFLMSKLMLLMHFHKYSKAGGDGPVGQA